MLFQLRQTGWSIGAFLIPVGTIINSGSTDQWSQLAAGHTPPLNAQPLDQSTYDAMKTAYHPEQFNQHGRLRRPSLLPLIITGPDIVR
jgi:hypothetical protein